MAKYLPVQLVRVVQLVQRERRTLANELDGARRGGLVVEADKHDIRQVHAADAHVQHPRCRLDLRLQSVRRPTEHHHRARKLEQELLPLDDLGNMARYLCDPSQQMN